MTKTERQGFEPQPNPALSVRRVRLIVQRDLKIIGASKTVVLTMIVVPLILIVLLPGALATFMPAMMEAGDLSEIQRFLEMMPPAMQNRLMDYNEMQMMTVALLVYFFAPLFLILPMMTASVIAAGSFAGEKERGTMEALLYTPTTDAELFVGKLLSAWLPALAITLGGFVLYGLVVNVASWRIMQRVFFPNLMWIVLIVWLAPAAAGLGLSSMVLISSKVNNFQDAYQLGGMVVIPIIALVIGQTAGVIYFSPLLVLGVGLVLWIVDAVLLVLGIRTFKRSEILARL
jgi:ABC-2 type transport system permease protein